MKPGALVRQAILDSKEGRGITLLSDGADLALPRFACPHPNPCILFSGDGSLPLPEAEEASPYPGGFDPVGEIKPSASLSRQPNTLNGSQGVALCGKPACTRKVGVDGITVMGSKMDDHDG